MAARLEPGRAASHEGLGIAQLKNGNLIAAESDFSRALERSPDSSNTHDLLGIVLAERGDLARAIAEFPTANAIDPNNESATKNLQQALVAEQQAGPLVESYENHVG